MKSFPEVPKDKSAKKERYKNPEVNAEYNDSRQENIKARYEREEGLTLHNTNLFDQDEDQWGNKTDPATGKPYDNSTYTGMEDLKIVDGIEPSDTEELDDEAGKWLEKNDPDRET